MEGSSFTSSGSNFPAAGAAKFLANLPSRGLFSSAVISSNPGGLRVYVCDHDTSPPGEQVIKTNQTNILIRSLTLKKQKADSSAKDSNGGPAAVLPRKRVAEKVVDGRSKKATTSAQQEGNTHTSNKDFQKLTVERLRALLKERGLSAKGKKDELVARLRNLYD